MGYANHHHEVTEQGNDLPPVRPQAATGVTVEDRAAMTATKTISDDHILGDTSVVAENVDTLLR